MTRWRVWRWPALVAAVTAVFVWNLVFDLWLGQAERQYLWKKAAHALGEARDVTLDGSIAVAVREGAWVATCWTAFVVGAILPGRLAGLPRRPAGRPGARHPALAERAWSGAAAVRRRPDWTFTIQNASQRKSCMSLFSTPTTKIEAPSVTALVWPLLIGAAIALVFSFGQQEVPVGLIAGGAFALGGVMGWLWRRSRARAAAASEP